MSRSHLVAAALLALMLPAGPARAAEPGSGYPEGKGLELTLYAPLVGDATTSAYANPQVDKLVDAARYELEPGKRKALCARALRIVHDDAPWLFLFQYEDLYATAKRLQWQPRPDEAIYVTEMRLP